MSTKKLNIKEVIAKKIDEYLDKAFAAKDADEQMRYREAIHALQEAFVKVSEVE